jgi:predicted nucleotidyltransferase
VFGAFASGEQTGTSSVGVLLDAPETDEASRREAAEYLEGVLGREVETADPALLTKRRRTRLLGEAVYVWSG